jgi:Dyp-type peroxidase family
MPDLTAPLRWETATGDDAILLEELQPNILKGHVRDSLAVLFLHFGDQTEAKTFLTALATGPSALMKSAKQHLEEIREFKASGAPGTSYVGVGLTRTGYDVLGIAAVPDDAAFTRGMKDPASRQTLGDPPLSTWEPAYQQDVHAVVLIGDINDDETSTTRDAVLALLTDSITVVGEETGLSQINENGDGIEHFGYVDGRSQPLFLVEDIEAERHGNDGINVWDPTAPLEQVLVADPAAPDPNLHFGSYFIFRKLEQNVRRFKQAEQDLADALGLKGDERERAGALIVGRFEDGTPITIQNDEGAHHPVMNNFTYDSDPDGAKCPFHAHIRKTNPRGSGGGEPPEGERVHLMARRGQTYGERTDVPFNDDVPIAERPSKDVGLLFMAFNAQISFPGHFSTAQFDFTQAIWANNPDFPFVPAGTPSPGIDPVIGQGERPAQTYPTEWGGSTTQEVEAIPQAVQMQGGEYFFMPSLAFLRSLAP